MRYIALDIETTDLSPQTGEIIEFAAIRHEEGRPEEKLTFLCRPQRRAIPHLVESLTGISDEMVAKQTSFATRIEEVELFLGDWPIVGHNINFDISFLRAAGVALEQNPIWDTWSLATMLFTERGSYSLEALAARLQIVNPEAHRAEPDARTGLLLFERLREELEALPREVLGEIRKLVKDTSWEMKDIFYEVSGKDAGFRAPIGPTVPHSEPRAKVLLDIDQLLGPRGKLSEIFPKFEYRAGQVEMAKAVAEALAKEQALVIEAGAGIGKSLAYLLPAAFQAHNSRRPVLIATSTRNLQDQLQNQDLPLLNQLLPFKVTSAVLKGRANYLCERRLQSELKRQPINNLDFWVKMLIWRARTQTGDFDEVVLRRQDQGLISRISSDGRNCSGRQCPSGTRCYWQKARAHAREVDLVIINQVLLLQSLRTAGEQLPAAAALIIDEAHRLEESATSAFGQELSLGQCEALINLSLSLAPSARKGITAWVEKVRLAFGLLGLIVRDRNESEWEEILRLTITAEVRDQYKWQKARGAFEKVIYGAENLREQLLESSERIKGREKVKRSQEIAAHLEEIAQALAAYFLEPSSAQIDWITFDQNNGECRLGRAPVSVAAELGEHIYGRFPALVLTSATLASAPEDFSFYAGRLGLDDFTFKQIESAYDYCRQALLLIPSDGSAPSSINHTDEVAEVGTAAARELGGRTLILLTSKASCRSVYEKIKVLLGDQKITVLAQGVTGGRAKIIEQFREAEKAVLIGADSFWQGIDIMGARLQVVIIGKLPFSVPTDPVHAARQAEYQNGFVEYVLPRAAIQLRQGFGRLIRGSKDRGAVILMDTRVRSERYGAVLLSALPRCTIEYLSKRNLISRTKLWLENK